MNAPQHRFSRRADHIALVVQSLSGGGVQMRMLALARQFARLGRSVDLYVDDDSRERPVGLPPSVRIIPLQRNRRTPDLVDALRRDSPDVLFSSGTRMHRIATGASNAVPDVPLVLRASVHPSRSIPWSQMREKLWEPIKRRIRDRHYRKADLIIAVSDDTAAGVRRIAPGVPIITLPSPVVSDAFALEAENLPNHPWADDGVPIILSIGRFVPSKDHPTIVAAFGMLRREREARLVILGDGSRKIRRKIIATARKYRVEQDVALLGWRNDVSAWLACADLFVLGSWYEGCPASVIEAMAAGCPIVATDSPGDSRRLLRDGELGELVPLRDAPAMAAAMARQLDDPVNPARLRAVAERYREGRAATMYLDALDHWVRLRSLGKRPSSAVAEPAPSRRAEEPKKELHLARR